MGSRKNDTLESIIRAARMMTQRRNQEQEELLTRDDSFSEEHSAAMAEDLPVKDNSIDNSPSGESGAAITEKPQVMDNSMDDSPSGEHNATMIESSPAMDNSMDNSPSEEHNAVMAESSLATDGSLSEENTTPTADATDMPTGSSDNDPDAAEKKLDFSNTEALLSAARTFSDTLQTAGVHFLEFSVAFLSMVKRHYQQDGGDIRANSLAFFALVALDSWADDDYTMSDLAEKLQIPKQQLTKLINDLEHKGLVERIHDTENRRRVYIRICEQGRTLMDRVKQDMLESTLHGLRSFSAEELTEMDHCICRLTELMEKFNTEPL